ncbi:MAG: hypothetical protein ABIJ21_00185 [Nanoarchaeota archaeon]
MKTINDYLSHEGILKYQEEWESFKEKYVLNTSKNTHSGLPVISRVYRFDTSQIFRAHVFNKRLRSFDPYHQADKCIQPFYHAQHYIMVGEQMYSACSRMIIGDEYDKKIAKDVPIEFRWKKPLFWSDNISIELIREECGTVSEYEKEMGYFTLYSDKTGKVLSRMSATSFWQSRSFIESIRQIQEGNLDAIDALVRKIEMQAINHTRLKRPRTTLRSTKEELIYSLRQGYIPELDVLDYFSLWE